ncbi:hypothetical protein [Pectobacterium polonicum]|uniref:hypothetical protein n=1 Tax=Pectobacterium polonicum TaxID=2485124 RepID=UPI002B24FEBA|nr:hypothetical protein [Pectobacterium polonicum]
MLRNSKRQLKELIDTVINGKSLNESLIDAKTLGEILSNNNIGVYSLTEIENSLSNRYINEIDTVVMKEISPVSINENLFVISQPYLSGGHTRLMERISSYLDDKPDLIITRKSGYDEKIRMKQYFKNVILYTEDEFPDGINRIFEVAKSLSQYKKLILNIHPDDIHTVISCALAKKINDNLTIYFVNHSDHTFSYGASVADVWFEISSLGQRIDDKRELHAKKSFLGIPLNMGNASKNTLNKSKRIQDGDSFFTSGTSYKFNKNKKSSFKEIISFVMKNYPQSTLYVVGCDIVNDPWWIVEKIKYTKRLKLMASIPHDIFLQITENASVYIDSHPIPGATAFPEQFIHGKKCIGLISPLQGYSSVERLKKNNIKDMFEYMSTSEEIDETYHILEEINAQESIKNRFIDALINNIHAENLCNKHLSWSGDISFLEKGKIMDFPISIRRKNNIVPICFKYLTFKEKANKISHLIYKKTVKKPFDKLIKSCFEYKHPR